MEHPRVASLYARSFDSALIEVYIQETVVPRITFNRAEFEAYYNDHPDQFREPEQFQLDHLEIADSARAAEMMKRLIDGADFAFVGRQFGAEFAGEDEKNQWIPLTSFPASIAGKIAASTAGGSVGPYRTADGWIIFRLRNRKPGRLKEMAEVDMKIREVMFQRKFDELLDETLHILKENAVIEYNQKALDGYFKEES